MSATAVATIDDKREAALLKAIGLDRVPVEQRELALNIATRYDLDLMLKHLVLVDGRPYITRDGLLHIAHRSGVFDGIEVTDPEEHDGYWHARATVFRKDMSRGFAYPGRYPVKGRNATFGPEMATKVAEVMALRRAFDVSAPVAEERWDLDTGEALLEPRQPVPLAAKVASRRADIEARLPDEPQALPVASGEVEADVPPAPSPDPEATETLVQCESVSPYEGGAQCRLQAGHQANHKSSSRETWQ